MGPKMTPKWPKKGLFWAISGYKREQKGSQKGSKMGHFGVQNGPFLDPFLTPFLTPFGQNLQSRTCNLARTCQKGVPK